MGNYTNSDDLELAINLQQGDPYAYEEIYQRYWRLLFRFSRKMLQSSEQAEDVVQEVFSILWQKRAVVFTNMDFDL